MKYIEAEKLYEYLEQITECYPGYANNTVDNAVSNVIVGIKTFITSLQQEQPEAELEKEIEEQFDRVSDGAEHVPVANLLRPTFTRIARHFYELGLNARKEGTK